MSKKTPQTQSSAPKEPTLGPRNKTSDPRSDVRTDVGAKQEKSERSFETKTLSKSNPKAEQPQGSPKVELKSEYKMNTPALIKRDQIFAHIPKRVKDLNQLSEEFTAKNLVIHPIVIEIGFRMNRDLIRGSNCRCVAMLFALKTVIEDYVTPPSKELVRDLESLIDTYVRFLAKCRPLSISMSNGVKFVKQSFSRIDAQTNDSTAKSELCKAIDYFITDEIMWAQRGIAELATTKVQDDDVILTFGCSLIVQHIIYKARQKGKRFRVIVVDSRPRFDGKRMLAFLVKHRIAATYVFINAISYVMKEVIV